MARFQALTLALDLVTELGPLVAKVQQHDRDLAQQLRRAGTSVPSCLSEGAQRAGRDRLHLFRTSAGSAAEIKVQLQIAVAWGYLEAGQASRALALADRMVAMTWRLTRPRT